MSVAAVVSVKRCPRCDTTKAIGLFPRCRGRRDGHGGWCKACQSSVGTSGVKRRSMLKSAYGITPEMYEEILAAQLGVCAVCGHPPAKKSRQSKSLAVDHDHATGQVRGLLCGRCNTALGLLRDDPANIVKLFDYLDAWLRRVVGL